MTGSDEAPPDAPMSMSQRQSRLFWTTIALAIAAILLLCTFLILIAAVRS
jgi:bacteriorhodopsin